MRAARAIARLLPEFSNDCSGRRLGMNDARCFTHAAASRENARSQSASLKHREMDHAVFDLAACEAGASDTLEFGPVFMEIAEGLVLRPKRRLETANLPN